MCSQTGPYYNNRAVLKGSGLFFKKGKSYFDRAFETEDIKQEAAIAAWLPNKNNTSTAVFGHLIDCWRKINFGKRNGKHLNQFDCVPFDIALDQLSFAKFDSRFWFSLNKLIQANKSEWPELENFMVLLYVDEMTRPMIRQKFKCTWLRIAQLDLKAKEIATEAADYEFSS